MKKPLRKAAVYLLSALFAFSSVMSPVSASFALDSNETDAASVPEGAAENSSSVAIDSSDGDNGSSVATSQEGSSAAAVGVNPASSVDSSEQEPESTGTQQEDSSYQYVYVAYPSLPKATDQVIAFSTPTDCDQIESATLKFVSSQGEESSVDAKTFSGNAAGFTFGKNLTADTYFLISITYKLKTEDTQFSIDLSNKDYSFQVSTSVVEGDATSVYYSDADGNAVEAPSIQQALECADSNDGVSTYAARSARKNVRVIALDAGHGGSDPGAQGNGKSEADLTWKIVAACKSKLEAYGFKVILARDQYGSYGSGDFLYRVQRCVNQGAQAYVSFHINSGSSAAHGAEVYAPTANGTDYTQVSVELAQKVMNNLAALGLSYRGVFQMSVGDEFAVIRCAREQGIPGILIEHGFISNAGDVWNYFSDDGCKRLGEADANAIIAQFPKSTWLDYSAVFDASYYLSHNPDVAKWTNGDKEKALEHFVQYGMSEGRRGNDAFDVQSYKNRYGDLRRAFGSTLKNYYLHYIDYGHQEGRNGSDTDFYEGLIMSRSFHSAKQAAALFKSKMGVNAYPLIFKSYGAATIDDFCQLIYEEATLEGVCPDVVFAQAMIETGWLQFGGSVKVSQCNFCGLGATSSNNPGCSFESVRIGIRAQVQHLKAYGSRDPLKLSCVDPRFNYVSRGCALWVTDLNGKWAVPGDQYGQSINRIVNSI